MGVVDSGTNAKKDAATLPPLPSLAREHVRVESAETYGFGTLEALVPAAAPYACSDPCAPALLLVAGLGVDGLSFIRQLPLGMIAHLHLIQTPNAAAAGEEGLGAYARYAEAYIQSRGLDEQPGGLIVGGASMGGAISLLMAVRGRVKLRGLVLLGTFGSCKHLPLYQRVLAPLAYVVPYGFMRSSSWLAKTYLGLHNTSREEAWWMAKPLMHRTHGYFGRTIRALTRFEQIASAAKLRVPTLVMHGALDPVLPLAAGKELAQTIRGARLVVVDNARHSLFFTHPDAVNAAIAEFIAGLPQR
jgi:pimeloyl-ACP methyl ester carboxylesterase